MNPFNCTVEEIRARFDREVDRFSNLETDQITIDAPLALELVQSTAARVCPNAWHLLELWWGAAPKTRGVI